MSSMLCHTSARHLFLYALLLACLGWTAPSSATTYVLLSLIGKKLTVVTALPETAGVVDRNKKEVIPLDDSALDLAALKATAAAVRKNLPAATVVMLRASDPRLYAIQDTWETDNRIDVAELVKLIGHVVNDPASHLIIICSWRAEPRLSYISGSTGSGKVAGLGFYVNTWEVWKRVDTGERANGFLAPFANFRLVLVDPRRVAVESEEDVSVGDVVAAAHAEDHNLWHALADREKVTRLQTLLAKGIEQATPRLLAASRP